MDNIEKEPQQEKKKRKISFLSVVLFPFKLIKVGMRVLSVVSLIFLIWFGYNFYNNFSKLEELGVNSEEAIIEAFTTTLSETKDSFSNIKEGVPSISFSFFINEYSDKDDIREAFIKTRGLPEAYVIIASYDEIKEGVPVKRDEPVWFEIWFYGNPYNKKVVFENGFFKEEKRIDNVDGFIDNNISPLFFTENITKNGVQSVFGTPSCTITEQAGSDTLTTYRFKETASTPLVATTFVNEKIIAVSSGIVFLGDNENSLCK